MKMRRREFIAVLGSAVALPVAVQAQQPKMPVIGVLTGVRPGNMSAFLQGLAETGYVEGRNVAIEYRSAGDRYDLLPALAAELVL